MGATTSEEKAIELIYEKEIDQWLERKNIFESSWTKAHATIFNSFCSSAMQGELRELPNFESDIEDDPLKLLDNVQTLMYTPMRVIYPYLGLIEAIARFVNLRMYENEEILDYLDRIKQEKNIVSSLQGKKCLDQFVENTQEYQDTSNDVNLGASDIALKQSKMTDEAFEVFSAAVFLRGAGKCYGTLNDEFRSQYAGGRDRYPKSLIAACDAMRQHKPSKRKHEGTRKTKENRPNPVVVYSRMGHHPMHQAKQEV